MMLCLAQSLVDRGGEFNAQDQVEKYIRWFETGYMSSVGKCFDIGTATRIAVGIWRKVLKEGEGKEEKEKKEGERRGGVGLGGGNGNGNGIVKEGQKWIDKSLKHEVSKYIPLLSKLRPLFDDLIIPPFFWEVRFTAATAR